MVIKPEEVTHTHHIHYTQHVPCVHIYHPLGILDFLKLNLLATVFRSVYNL